MFGRLRALWAHLTGFLFGTDGGAVIRKALARLIEEIGATAASYLLEEARRRAHLIEEAYPGSGRGSEKANDLGNQLTGAALQIGVNLGGWALNELIQAGVGAMKTERGD
jgi:hypothetical protein